MTKTITLLSLVLAYCLVFSLDSCKKKQVAVGIDKELFDSSKSATGFVWFKKSAVLLDKSSGSGHSQPKFKTKFNSIASTMLDGSGKIIPASKFPEGSLVVKEVYASNNSLSGYAVLLKRTGHADADANGWIWGIANADGTVNKAAADKGSGCISCHKQADNIDYMLMNKYFP